MVDDRVGLVNRKKCLILLGGESQCLLLLS